MVKNTILIFILNAILISSILSKKTKEFTSLTKYLNGLNENNVVFLGVELERNFLRQEKYKNLYNYRGILKKNGISWNFHSMSRADVSKFDAEAILALILGAFRAERFNQGVIIEFYKNNSIYKWLKRLKEIDESK